MRKYLLSAAVLSGMVLAAGGNGAWAANLFAGEDFSPTQDTYFQPDANWDFTPFTQTGYNAGTDTVTGSGSYFATTDGDGVATVYLTEADGVTVSDVLHLSYAGTNPGGSGVELVTATWQSDDDVTGSTGLGTVPNGAASLIETGGVQDVTSLLAGQFNFPSNLTVEVQSEIPEPASMALLGVGLAGLGLLRRRKRARS